MSRAARPVVPCKFYRLRTKRRVLRLLFGPFIIHLPSNIGNVLQM